MSTLGNLIWLIFGGFLTGLGYIIGGLGFMLTIVGIPFGKEVVESENANSPLRVIFNLIWLVLFGWEIALAHLVHAAILAITIIGLPFAKQHIKLIPVALMPLGRQLR